MSARGAGDSICRDVGCRPLRGLLGFNARSDFLSNASSEKTLTQLCELCVLCGWIYPAPGLELKDESLSRLMGNYRGRVSDSPGTPNLFRRIQLVWETAWRHSL